MTIVVGYAPTGEGRAALSRAVEEALQRRLRLVVVNSSRGDALADSGFAAEAEIVAIRGQLEQAGVEFEVRRPVRGKEAAEEVIGAATEVGASLIVIGLRRRTPVGKLILGSNAQRILLDAECPVLAVKATG
jgi:nucleotide-binding universal stress UspA family protein